MVVMGKGIKRTWCTFVCAKRDGSVAYIRFLKENDTFMLKHLSFEGSTKGIQQCLDSMSSPLLLSGGACVTCSVPLQTANRWSHL